MRRLKTPEALQIAELIRDAPRPHRAPVFFFGAGASISSGVTASEEFFSTLSRSTGTQISNLAELEQNLCHEQIIRAFIEQLRGSTPGRGYQYLAELVARRYFTILITTNWDLLFEHELRKRLSPDELLIHSRYIDPNQNPQQDREIAEALSKSDPCSIHLIRLHGDIRNQVIYGPSQLMDLGGELAAQLQQEIRKRGVIITGYSLEPGFFRILPNVRRIPFVGIVNPENNVWQQSLGSQSRAGSNIRYVNNEDARFDSFIEGLTRHLLSTRLTNHRLIKGGCNGDPEQPDFSPNKAYIDPIVDNVNVELERNDYSERAVSTLVIELFERLRAQRMLRKKTCLLFINDPEAPGGIEVKRVAQEKPQLAWAATGFSWLEIRIQGRNAKNREIQRFDSIRDKLRRFKQIVVVDSVAFSGNTLNKIREKLTTELGYNKTQIKVALMVVSEKTRKQLKADGWEVFFGEIHNEWLLVCPWGVTRPTTPIISHGIDCNSYVDKEPTLSTANFLPYRQFGYIPKPWGDQISVVENQRASVRILEFDKGQRTSLHYHLLRDEVFIVLDDRIRVQLWGDRFRVLHKNESIRIRAGVPHSLIALEQPCRILEISSGFCDQEKDLFRIEDNYQRPGCGVESNGLE